MFPLKNLARKGLKLWCINNRVTFHLHSDGNLMDHIAIAFASEKIE